MDFDLIIVDEEELGEGVVEGLEGGIEEGGVLEVGLEGEEVKDWDEGMENGVEKEEDVDEVDGEDVEGGDEEGVKDGEEVVEGV